MTKSAKLTVGAAALAVALATLAPADATARSKIKRPAYGLTAATRSSASTPPTPPAPAAPGTITGVTAGENIVGIDFRPSTGLLYALGSTGSIYSLDPAQSSQATKVSSLQTADGGPVALSGTRFGIDFNPVVDRLRVVSNSGQNLRVNADTGVTTVDQALAYGPGDRNAGGRPSAVGPPTRTTTTTPCSAAAHPDRPAGDRDQALHGRFGAGCAGPAGPPERGTLATIGRLPRRSSSAIGFDVYSLANSEGNVLGNVAYASLRRSGRAQLYKVSLRTGKASRVKGGGGSFRTVEDIAIRP